MVKLRLETDYKREDVLELAKRLKVKVELDDKGHPPPKSILYGTLAEWLKMNAGMLEVVTCESLVEAGLLAWDAEDLKGKATSPSALTPSKGAVKQVLWDAADAMDEMLFIQVSKDCAVRINGSSTFFKAPSSKDKNVYRVRKATRDELLRMGVLLAGG